MTEKLNEYKHLPKLSAEAQKFVDNYNDEEVPPKIRAELVDYLEKMKPFVEAGNKRLEKAFADVFKQ